MLDYEELILERQDLQEIYEDDPDSSLCSDNKCWWDDIPDEEFGELKEDDLFYEDDLYNGVRLV